MAATATRVDCHATPGWERCLEERARSHPDRVAVVAEDGELCYGELNRAANRLARRLVAVGVGPGVPVGLCLPRSAEAVAGFLAVWKAGGAALPLDPELPTERLASALRCGPGALVATAALRERVPAEGLPVVCLDRERDGLAGESDEDLGLPTAGDVWAYVLYTSGSTGTPRGVAVSRRALALYAESLREGLGLREDDVCLHLASFSFSAAIRQLVAPLTAGATLVMAGEATRRDPIALLARMREREVSVWDTVPSAWRHVERVVARVGATDPSVRVPDSVRAVLLTGEPLGWDLVRAWRRHLRDGVGIWNLYSQTEAAGTVALERVGPAPDDHAEGGCVPLGRPLPGARLHLLDPDLRPVPPGEVGEICVSSERLAEGYLEAPKRSAERFVADPFSSEPAARMLRTGDLGRRTEDGDLVWAGRSDRRVKVRGVGVDLEEVESALRADAELRDAVVVATERETGELALTACVVPEKSAAPALPELRGRLRARLPEPAIPSALVVREALPTLASGKPDRAALARLASAAPAAPNPVRGTEAPEAADATEALLLRAWESVLEYEPARPDDDFFTHGGDSLRAVDLFVEIEERLGVRLPPATLFEAPTVGRLSALVRGQGGRSAEISVLALRAGDARPPLFFVHAIWDFLPHFRTLARLLREDQPVYALEPMGADGRGGRELDMHALAARYVSQIRSVRPRGPYVVAGLSIGGVMAYEVAQRLREQGERPATVLLLDAAAPVLRRVRRRRGPHPLAARARRWRRAVRRQWRSFRLPPRAQWRRLVAKLHRVLLRSAERLTAAQRRARRNRFKDAYRRVVDAYEARPYDGPVTLFRSEAPAEDPRLDRDLGWSALVPRLEVVEMPGDHCSMIFEPNVAGFAAAMQRTIDRAAEAAAAEGRRSSPAKEEDGDADVTAFAARSRELDGKEVREREPWNTIATADAIRHFAYGTADDNPLWLDPEYARASPHGRLLAPPTFLLSVLYPVLHGSTEGAPLSSLLRDLELRWERTIGEGERLRGVTEQRGVREARDRGGRLRVYVETHTTWLDERDRVVGRAQATVVRLRHREGDRVVARETQRYRSEELERIVAAIDAESRSGPAGPTGDRVEVGQPLPPIVRGPLTIGDLVCWNAAVGPAYRPGPLGLKDTRATPGFTVRNPVTGWPVKFTHQHEDVHLTGQRGMPAPFDNGVMRFAWAAPLLTNWMGDRGFLARLHLWIHAPVLYGDTNWFSGEIVAKADEGETTRVRVRVTGTNQLGAVTTAGEAEVLLPRA